MTPNVLHSERLVVAAEDDVILARRKVRQLAEALGYDQFSIAAIATATSELCRNTWIHATKGSAPEPLSASDCFRRSHSASFVWCDEESE